jgi:hypothetical protein
MLPGLEALPFGSSPSLRTHSPSLRRFLMDRCILSHDIIEEVFVSDEPPSRVQWVAYVIEIYHLVRGLACTTGFKASTVWTLAETQSSQ